ncbi:Lcl domain-containing protein [Alishewanella longhuensis]
MLTACPLRLSTLFLLWLTLLLTACGSEDKKPIYVVSTQVNNGGTITPSSLEVQAGQTATFTLSLNTGYELAQIDGCSGTLTGNQFITAPITNACQITASFRINLTPVTAVNVSEGDESLIISWAAVPGATSYHIYLSNFPEIIPEQYDPTFGTLLRFSSATTSITTHGLVNNLPYYIGVTAVLDNTQSVLSSVVRGIPRTLTTKTMQLNDTGIQSCADELSKNLNCPVIDYPGQDAEYGRDAMAQKGLLSKIGNGIAGFDFTKLASDGSELPIQNRAWDPINGSEQDGTLWSCVRDNVTGLVWEIKTADGGLRDQQYVFSWTSSDPRIKGAENGPIDFGNCNAINCDTASYNQAVNALRLCGANNWRLPTRQELASIVVHRLESPALDTHYFPERHTNPLQDPYYWTSSVFAYPMPLLGYSDGRVWQINVQTGHYLNRRLEFEAAYVRLVHNAVE